jgi:hypothetical protein
MSYRLTVLLFSTLCLLVCGVSEAQQAMVQHFRWRNGSPRPVTITTNADGYRLRCSPRAAAFASNGFVYPNEDGDFAPDADGNLRITFTRGGCAGHDAIVPASSVTTFEPRRARNSDPVGVRLGESAVTEWWRRVTGQGERCAFEHGSTDAEGNLINPILRRCGVIGGTARGQVTATPNEDPSIGYSILRITESSGRGCVGLSVYVPNRCIDDELTGSARAEGRLAETDECEDCHVETRGGTHDQLVEAMETALNLPISLSELTPLPQDMGRTECENMIRSNGEPGQVGLQVLAAMNQHRQCYFGGGMAPDAAVCPGFSGFNDQQKANFWAYTFAAIAKDRSNCTLERSSSNGRYDGIFNLPYSWRHRRDLGLDSSHCATRGPADSRDLGFQANCAVATLANNSCSHGARVGNGESYWDNLQQSTGSISNILKRFPGCN